MTKERPKREWIALGFTVVEDIVYLGLGLLLAGISVALLVSGLISFGEHLVAGSLASNVVALLDRGLLILLIIELLYTVQVSFREHALVPEPFLLIGLIAAIRRILLLTTEMAQVQTKSNEVFQHFLAELVVLTFLILALAISLVLLRKRAAAAVAAERGREPPSDR